MTSTSSGCRRKLAPGQWWGFCGETDMGQTGPARCTECGGEFILDGVPDQEEKVAALITRSEAEVLALKQSKILNTRFYSNDLREEVTVRKFFSAILIELWNQEEGFSGKRPLGNSGWKRDLKVALINAGVVRGRLDEDGCVEEIDLAAFDAAILSVLSV